MSRNTRYQIAREEAFAYLSRCAIRGEQGAIETIKRIERENGVREPRKISEAEKANHPNDDDCCF